MTEKMIVFICFIAMAAILVFFILHKTEVRCPKCNKIMVADKINGNGKVFVCSACGYIEPEIIKDKAP